MDIDCLCAGILFADVACAPVPRLPKAGELVPTERMQLGLGGCASNTGLDLTLPTQDFYVTRESQIGTSGRDTVRPSGGNPLLD